MSDKQIQYIFDQVKDISVNYLKEARDSFSGISEADIEELEKLFGRKLPRTYLYFLREMAGSRLKIFDLQLYNKEGVIQALEVADELTKTDNYTLPQNSIVFSQWQGYQFYYFIYDERTDNPETFLYIEGGCVPSQPPQVFRWPCFTDWLVDLTINSMHIQSRLYSFDASEGVELLKGLLINKNSLNIT